jgi:hypothetical protein
MKDFYSGFEGYPEIIMELKGPGGSIETIRMWDGHFDAIMTLIEPENGEWTGLALPYNLLQGWFEVSPWRVPNMKEVLTQWEKIDESKIPASCRLLHQAVRDLMREAVKSGAELWISEE